MGLHYHVFSFLVTAAVATSLSQKKRFVQVSLAQAWFEKLGLESLVRRRGDLVNLEGSSLRGNDHRLGYPGERGFYPRFFFCRAGIRLLGKPLLRREEKDSFQK